MEIKKGQTASVPLGSRPHYSSLESNDKQRLRKLLYILEKFAVSDAAYYELSAICEEIPRSYLIVQKGAKHKSNDPY